MKNDIIQALQWRFAARAFDTSKKVSEEDLSAILESGRFAPSSFGLEPWKFLVVNNPEVRASLRAAGYDQAKITDASHLIVIAVRTDADHLPDELVARTAAAQGKQPEDLQGLKDMASGAIARRSSATAAWLSAQTYIPLGVMVETASLLGVDNAPMEGFDVAKVNEILGLDAKNLSAVTMLALGYRAEEPWPKARRQSSDVIEII
ncbi:MAG TPA: NAD(P)H-dependent oxidoreductase [Candidatus Paceibacterota bacterium]|jgi:nitroreductase|nr:NAD(P)H-dependent oxidoreductase [Candidatus Paceibacterota bacterium]